MLGKIEGRRKRGPQRMRWLGSITDSRDVRLSTLWETMKDREAWRATVHEVEKSRMLLSDWTRTTAGAGWLLPGGNGLSCALQHGVAAFLAPIHHQMSILPPPQVPVIKDTCGQRPLGDKSRTTEIRNMKTFCRTDLCTRDTLFSSSYKIIYNWKWPSVTGENLGDWVREIELIEWTLLLLKEIPFDLCPDWPALCSGTSWARQGEGQLP